MRQVIYIDVFFATNFIMDFLMLIGVRKIIHSNAKVYKSVYAATAGAAYACLIIMKNFGYGILEGFCTYVLISMLMVFIAFGKAHISVLIKNAIILNVISLIMSGVVNTMYYRTGFGSLLNYMTDATIFGKINPLILLVTAIMGYAIVVQVTILFKKNLKTDRQIVNVKLVKGKNEIEVRALLDTGNSLTEPISKKSVSILTKDCVEKLKKGETNEGIRIIPYRSVGQNHGMLMGFQVDYMEITNDGMKRKIKEPMIAEYEGKLTDTDEYKMILHPQMIEEGEEKEDGYKVINSKQNAVKSSSNNKKPAFSKTGRYSLYRRH